MEDRTLAPLVAAVREAVIEFGGDARVAATSSVLDVRLTGWANVNRRGDSNVEHLDQDWAISGVMWLDDGGDATCALRCRPAAAEDGGRRQRRRRRRRRRGRGGVPGGRGRRLSGARHWVPAHVATAPASPSRSTPPPSSTAASCPKGPRSRSPRWLRRSSRRPPASPRSRCCAAAVADAPAVGAARALRRPPPRVRRAARAAARRRRCARAALRAARAARRARRCPRRPHAATRARPRWRSPRGGRAGGGGAAGRRRSTASSWASPARKTMMPTTPAVVPDVRVAAGDLEAHIAAPSGGRARGCAAPPGALSCSRGSGRAVGGDGAARVLAQRALRLGVR